jgi:phosphoribosylformylglycinamidine cyclo-ligase
VLPDGIDARVDASTWERPRIFDEVRRAGAIDEEEMATVFNLGIGMVVAVPSEAVSDTLQTLERHGHRAVAIGTLGPGTGQVHLDGTP